MAEADFSMHYVSTLGEAEDLIAQHDRFWVMSCGCRDERGTCGRSRHDVCLMFREGIASEGTPITELSRNDVDAILAEAREKRLVARPFRDMQNKDATDGICFCCDDCCAYFLSPEEQCDRGASIEQTTMADCTHCALCEEVCYFKARKMDDGVLTVDRDACYGCGLCADVCPEDCIKMARRAS